MLLMVATAALAVNCSSSSKGSVGSGGASGSGAVDGAAGASGGGGTGSADASLGGSSGAGGSPSGGNAGSSGSGGAGGGASGAGGQVGGAGGSDAGGTTGSGGSGTGGTSGGGGQAGGTGGTTGGSGGVDASTDAGSVDAASDASVDTGVVDAGPCPGLLGGDGSAHYPRWPVPAGDSRATAEFILSTNTAIDKQTCVMWQRQHDAAIFTWQGAKTYCDDLGLDNHTDWRLPTRAELISISDFTIQAPALNATVFPTSTTSAETSRFWSSTTTAWNPALRWIVLHGSISQVSYIDGTSATPLARVRCVRANGAPPAARFDSSSSGIVKEVETGLSWEASPPNADYSPVQAKAHCDALSLGGFQDWRIPKIRELLLLVDTGVHTPALPGIFTTPGQTYWSSTLVVASTTNFWGMYSNTGFSQPEQPPGTVYNQPRVRCVR